MSYHNELLPGEPIVVAHLHADFSLANETQSSIVETRRVLDSVDEPIFYILDLSNLTINIHDLISGTNSSSRGEDPLWHHPNIREFLVVSQSKLIQLAAAGLNSVSFGNLEAKMFGSLDEALAYCREQIRAG